MSRVPLTHKRLGHSRASMAPLFLKVKSSPMVPSRGNSMLTQRCVADTSMNPPTCARLPKSADVSARLVVIIKSPLTELRLRALSVPSSGFLLMNTFPIRDTIIGNSTMRSALLPSTLMSFSLPVPRRADNVTEIKSELFVMTMPPTLKEGKSRAVRDWLLLTSTQFVISSDGNKTVVRRVLLTNITSQLVRSASVPVIPTDVSSLKESFVISLLLLTSSFNSIERSRGKSASTSAWLSRIWSDTSGPTREEKSAVSKPSFLFSVTESALDRRLKSRLVIAVLLAKYTVLAEFKLGKRAEVKRSLLSILTSMEDSNSGKLASVSCPFAFTSMCWQYTRLVK
mmetsp:Transcript_59937/g.159520  ORF Transcript_59937/g.159520 Transcript_59937/m.159520 type:complete len:341 (-) Transcript_59937:20-1042(-)